ncbi:DUF418 domain-containing protein [Paenibacillaceae bacterium WGS1546]|uniref:DUF418 domain-containing protein n=1 Tax=Cohnella sp. WGS1546 TaxID=3366810 RepID=UPI00372D6D80
MMATGARIRLLDILRGFAVLGTLGTNIWIFAHLGDLNYVFTFAESRWWASFQDFLRVFVLFLVNGKLLGLLTIMFGVGLELKYRQALKRGNAWPGVYIWASILLMAEGFIHFTLVMEYDILMSYGVAAIVTAFILKGGDRAIRGTMRIIGGIHGAMMLLIMAALIALGATGGHFSFGDMSEVVLLYKEGSWLQQMAFRLENMLLLRFESVFVVPMNVFLFLLGVRMMRSGVFALDEHGRKKRGKLLRIGLWIGLPLNMLMFIPGGYFDLTIRYLFAPLMALGYIGLIARLVESNGKLWLWRKLEQVGKMSLSCYVMQNILCAILFYGWGFGLGGKVDSFAIVCIWLAVCGFQVVFASLWLNRFKLGPMETARRFASGLIGKT